MNLTTLATSFQTYFATLRNILTVKYISSLVTAPVTLEVGRTNFFNDDKFEHKLPDPEDCGSGSFIEIAAFANRKAKITVDQKPGGIKADIRWIDGLNITSMDVVVIDVPGTFKFRSVVTTDERTGEITDKYWRI